VIARELTIAGTVHHPEFIGDDWQRVDHPTCRPLQDGAAELGWEGDNRLVVYLHKPAQTFVLWRLEANGEYLPVGSFGLGQEITPASINQTIRRLVEVDSRNGFDPYLDVIGKIEAQERSDARDRWDALSEFADKFLFGLSQSHLPGVDISRVRNVNVRR
jgi:hypothetical protein